MNKIILVLLALLLVCASAGCIAEEETEDEYIPNYKYSSDYVYLYIDEYTGVEYLIFSVGSNKGGITPRYNADGTLKINEEFKNDY